MTKRIIVKIIWSGLILVVLFMLTGNATFIASLLSAIGLSIFSFLLVDLFILPRATIALATMIDAILAYLFIWAISSNNGWSVSIAEVFAITIVLTIFEYFYHDWLVENGIKRDKNLKVE
ncbi:hypothetical protein D3C77_505120 [compost metagenome]